MKLARDGLPTIFGLAFMVIGGGLISPWISALLSFPLMLAIWFYRDPERMPEASSGWLSPADGKVVEIEEVDRARRDVAPAAPARWIAQGCIIAAAAGQGREQCVEIETVEQG